MRGGPHLQDALHPPVLRENAPQDLVVILAVAKERATEHAFLHRAQLAQRAVTAPVRRGRARLEAMRADHAEREVEDEAGAFHEDPRAPVFRAHREAPLRRAEARLERAHLEDANRRVHPGGHDREARVAAGAALTMRPRDEALEAFDRSRRRRDEARHFLSREHREQRGRVFLAQLAEREVRSGHYRKRLLPVRDRRRCSWRHHGRGLVQLVLEGHLFHYWSPPSEPLPLPLGAGFSTGATSNRSSNRSGLNVSTSDMSSPKNNSSSSAEQIGRAS